MYQSSCPTCNSAAVSIWARGFAVVASCALLFGVTSCRWCCFLSPAPPQAVYDGFESPGLGRAWSSGKFERGAVTMQSDIVRSGRSAVKITVRQGDKRETRDRLGEVTPNERAELTEAADLQSSEGEAAAYSFSLFIPKTFPISDTRLILAQWKQKDTGSALINNPVLALRYSAGELMLTQKVGPQRKVLYSTKKDIRGRWLDFVIQIKYDRSAQGAIYAWLNRQPIVRYAGPTAYGQESGYPEQGRFYFKMGLYRDSIREPMSVFYDDYRKEPLGATGTGL